VSIEKVCHNGVEDCVTQEFKPFVGLCLRAQVLEKGAMQERLLEKRPISWAIGNELLKPVNVKFLLAERLLEDCHILTGKN